MQASHRALGTQLAIMPGSFTSLSGKEFCRVGESWPPHRIVKKRDDRVLMLGWEAESHNPSV